MAGVGNCQEQAPSSDYFERAGIRGDLAGARNGLNLACNVNSLIYFIAPPQ
jgi:hypothetical protein